MRPVCFILYCMKKKQKQRVLVGLSGGVDSAVSAYLLLKAGYEVEGAFMKNWSATTGLKLAECPWLADRQEALRVAAFLGIPLHTLDFEQQYQDKVMTYFFAEYKAGRTPNPDVMCNKEIKFRLLYDWAMVQGFDFLATGHYAQIVQVSSNKLLVTSRKETESSRNSQLGTCNYILVRSVDEFKDQTYFIYNIRTEQLPHVLFPIGGMKKPEVKKLAEKIGLPNAKRKESMGLCFVGKVRLKEFLEQEVKAKPGPIVLVSSEQGKVNREGKKSTLARDSKLDTRNLVIGTHQGLHAYTIGQRQGINVGGPGGPYYVVRKDLKTNTLFVTNDPNDPALEISEVLLHSVNWITKPVPSTQYLVHSKNTKNYEPSTKHSLSARYRHQGELVPCTVEQTGEDEYVVKFKEPQKAVASGQSVVLYNGKVCVGGGVIV